MLHVLCLAFSLVVSLCNAGEFITFSYGGRSNKLYVPSNANTARPLYVMMHGCTQNPTDFATGTKMNTYGEEYGLFVLYPEQTSSANMNKCWNWFESADQRRGSGEPKLIVDMIGAVEQSYPGKIDTKRVYVGGLSAGAAMSVILGVLYPDVFAAIAVGAGLEWKAATSMVSAFTAMSSGGPNPVTQGNAAYTAMGSYARPQGVLVIHGTSDSTVSLVNGKQVVTQYARTNDKCLSGGTGRLTDVPTATKTGRAGRAWTLYEYDDANTGKTWVQFLEVTGMAHAWSGGSSQGTYTDSTGPDASLLMIEFFATFPNGGNSTTTGGNVTTTGGSSSTTGGSSGGTTGGTTSTTGGSSSTTGSNSNVISFSAVSSQSGFVGEIYLDGYSVDEAKVGTPGGVRTDVYRTILSFDTSALPPGTVASAILRVFRQRVEGTIEDFSVSIKAGHFGLSDALVQTDYWAQADVSDFATARIPGQDNQSVDIAIPGSALQYIKNGPNARTSFRLASDAYAFSGTVFRLHGGSQETSQYAPTLVVTMA